MKKRIVAALAIGALICLTACSGKTEGGKPASDGENTDGTATPIETLKPTETPMLLETARPKETPESSEMTRPSEIPETKETSMPGPADGKTEQGRGSVTPGTMSTAEFPHNRIGFYYDGSDPKVIVEVTAIDGDTITFNLRDYDNSFFGDYSKMEYTELNQVTGTILDENTAEYQDSQYDFTMTWVKPDNPGLDLAGSIYFNGTWPDNSSISPEYCCYNSEDSNKLHTN